MKNTKQLTKIELWEIISKEFVRSNEISQICCVGIGRAQKIRREISSKLNNWLLPNYQIPTRELLKMFNIDYNQIYEKALMEKRLTSNSNSEI